MECFICGERGCDNCNDTGEILIADCPLNVIPVETWDMIELAELYEKGLPPIAGGSLDQLRAFVVAFRIFTKAKARHKMIGV